MSKSKIEDKSKIEKLVNEFIYGSDNSGDCNRPEYAAGYIFDGRLHYIENHELKSVYKDKNIKIGNWVKRYVVVEYKTLLLVMTDIGLAVQNITLNAVHDDGSLQVEFGESSLLEVDSNVIERAWLYAKSEGGKFEYVTYTDLPLYLVEREVCVDYDEYDSLLVVCRNEDEVRRVILSYSGFDRDAKIKITEIGRSNLKVNCPTIPIASFNAG